MDVRRSPIVLTLALALVLAGCGTSPELPTDALEDALTRTFEGSFEYRVTFDLDDAALAELRADDPQLAGVLQTLEVRGVHDDPGHSLAVSALGSEILEVRRVDETRTYARVDFGAIAGLSGEPFDPATMVDGFLMYGLENALPDLRGILETLVAGEWIGFDVDADRLAESVDEWAGGDPFMQAPLVPFGGFGGGAELLEAFEVHVASDPEEFIDRFTRVGERSEGGIRHLSVELRLRPLLAAVSSALAEVWAPYTIMREEIERELDGVPESMSGLTVDIQGRLIHRVAFDLLEAARSAGADEVPDGSASLVLQLTEHGSAAPVAAPEGARIVDLVDLLERFLEATPSSYFDVVEEDIEVDVVPDERSTRIDEPAWGDDLHSLVLAQEARFAEHGAYSDDLEELLEYGFHPFPGTGYGTCTFDDGSGSVVAATTPDGVVYIDSHGAVATGEPGNLACVPELESPPTG